MGKGIKRRGEDRGGGVFTHMGFPDASVHRAKRKRRNIADDYKTHIDNARARAFQTSNIMEAPLHQTGCRTKTTAWNEW